MSIIASASNIPTELFIIYFLYLMFGVFKAWFLIMFSAIRIITAAGDQELHGIRNAFACRRASQIKIMEKVADV
jgi:hypothetical protein